MQCMKCEQKKTCDFTEFFLVALQIRCAAMNGHPSARISWEEPRGARIDFQSEPDLHQGTEHTKSVFHTVTYRYTSSHNLII